MSQLVVKHADDCNAVSKRLKTRDFGSPNEHGGTDEKNILEDTAESKDQAGGFANLFLWLAYLQYASRTNLTKNTTETFRRNAQAALAKKVQSPTA